MRGTWGLLRCAVVELVLDLVAVEALQERAVDRDPHRLRERVVDDRAQHDDRYEDGEQRRDSGTFGIVSTNAMTNTIVKRPPTAMTSMASAPAKKPSSLSKCSPHVGQSSTMFK